MKCRSRAAGHGACLKSTWHAYVNDSYCTMQGFTLAAITATEKHSFVLDLTKNIDKDNGA